MQQTENITVGEIPASTDTYGAQDGSTTGVMEIYLAKPNGKWWPIPAATEEFTTRKHRRRIAKAWFNQYAKPYLIIIKPDL